MPFFVKTEIIKKEYLIKKEAAIQQQDPKHNQYGYDREKLIKEVCQ